MRDKSASLVVFGATGDLMARKILPSLFYLNKERKLPNGFHVIGVSRRDITEEGFREKMRESMSRYDEIAKDKKITAFLRMFNFVKGYFGDNNTYVDLKKVLGGRDGKIFFYLAVAPKFFNIVLENIARAGLINSRTYLLIEKPIGLDLLSAKKVELLLSKYFSEKKIYRIDHYLAKEGMDNLFDFRFRKKYLEKIWSKDFISSIELFLWEHKDAAGRGEFYDGIGALRDVGQNHLSAMLAYAAMDTPGNFSAREIRKKRAELLKALKIYKPDQARKFSYRAQYRGFRNLPGVKKNSKTETFSILTGFFNSGRFKGVSVMMEVGKGMPGNRKEIIVNFKDGKKIIFPIEAHLHKYQYIEEYKKILSHAFRDDDSIFLGKEEVLASWKFIDPFVAAFKKNLVPLKFYEPNTYPKI